MASKKYPTLKAALDLPEGYNIRNLTTADLQARLQTVIPVVWKRVKRFETSGTPILATPVTKYPRNASRAVLEEIFRQNREFLSRKTSTLRGAKSVLREAKKRLLERDPVFSKMTNKQVKKVFATLDKIKEMRPEWFTTHGDSDPIITEILNNINYRRGASRNASEIVDELEKRYEQEKEDNADLYGREEYMEV